MEMRRSERQVCDINEIYGILSRCDTMALGMNGGNEPYIVPMTFACSLENGQITVYFHSAKGGRKWEILNRDPRVCVEAHLYYKTVQENNSVTAKYESVIGTGSVEKVEDKKEKVEIFKLMLDHYRQSGFPAQSCKGLSECETFKVVLTEVNGKHNL